MRKMVKKYQKEVNKVIHKVNKNIENDDLWRGRFCMRQLSYRFAKYEDNSGGDYHAIVKFMDKKTGKYKIFTMPYSYSFMPYHYFMTMNNFIVKDIDVWGNETMEEMRAGGDYSAMEFVPKESLNYNGYYPLGD